MIVAGMIMIISLFAGTRSIDPAIYARYPRRLSYESIPLCGTSALQKHYPRVWTRLENIF